MHDLHPIHTDMQKVVSYSVRTRQDLQRTLTQEMEEAVASTGNNAWEGKPPPSSDVKKTS